MTPRIVGATAIRVVKRLRRDPRTLGMIVVVPSVLILLLKYVLEGRDASFDRIGAPLVGLFPTILMFLVTSITMLRERTTRRWSASRPPLAKLDLLLGYGIAFALVAAVQATIVSAVAFGLLGVEAAGSTIAVVLLAIANAVLGMALGLLASAFAGPSSRRSSSCPRSSSPSSCSTAASSSPRSDGSATGRSPMRCR